MSETTNRRYRRRRDQGLCGACGRVEPDLGRSMCATCKAKADVALAKHKAKYRNDSKSAGQAEGQEGACEA